MVYQLNLSLHFKNYLKSRNSTSSILLRHNFLWQLNDLFCLQNILRREYTTNTSHYLTLYIRLEKKVTIRNQFEIILGYIKLYISVVTRVNTWNKLKIMIVNNI